MVFAASEAYRPGTAAYRAGSRSCRCSRSASAPGECASGPGGPRSARANSIRCTCRTEEERPQASACPGSGSCGAGC
jgi:hypothetical protein